MRDLEILKNFNILYLEDDKDLLEHTSDILVDFVKNIYAVKTSAEAMKILLEEKIDIVVSDILLENENGIDFLKYIKDRNIQIPTILTTAYTDTNYLLEAIKLKIHNYIVKPINIKEFLDCLYDALLPRVQKQELNKNLNIIKAISAVTDTKQVEIINHIFNNLDKKNQFYSSYADIMEKFSISKPTLIKLFKDLSNKNILKKVSLKTYKVNEYILNDYI